MQRLLRSLTPHAAPPIVVANEPISNFSNHKTKIGTVKLLTALDVIKDRLAGYYH
ncbi:hypothetical protein [Simkania negevensis]|uniref:hypothetical protein n=1 Tax=Simkania negevensis TaxID=83561 RepID=UPI0013053DA4|nr:hypothetical protein [Simkania negevensis]